MLYKTDRFCSHRGQGSTSTADADNLHLVFECLVIQPLRQQYGGLLAPETDTIYLIYEMMLWTKGLHASFQV